MRHTVKPFIGFALFALVSILVTALVWNTLARNVTGDTTRYTATFTDVLGLHEGDDVRVAGVRVGKVEAIGLARDAQRRKTVARVTFVIQRDQMIYDDTKALVRYQNLLGQRILALAPGHTPGALRLRETFVQALQGDGVSVSAFITQAVTLADDFHRRDEVLSGVIADLSGVMHGLAGRSDELETLVTQTRALVSGLYEQGQTLQRSTTRIADATSSMIGMMDRIEPKLRETQNSTSAALALLLANGAELDRAAIDLPDVLAHAGNNASNGGFATGYLCGLDISLCGVLFPRGMFSQIGGDSHSAVCRP
ncbi:MlaD family protein [Nocardia arthritidis]|nr:MlaD family protein [Nocardia arthritidis]